MQRDRARCFTFAPCHLGASLSCLVVWFAGGVGVFFFCWLVVLMVPRFFAWHLPRAN